MRKGSLAILHGCFVPFLLLLGSCRSPYTPKVPQSSAMDQASQAQHHQNINEYVQKIDPGVQFRFYNEALGKELGLEDKMNAHPEFERFIITFSQLPGDPPYQILQRRILKEMHPEKFRALTGFSEEGSTDSSRKPLVGYHLGLSAYGYVPGEKVILRICSKDSAVYKEIVWYPRPFVIRRNSGEVLLRANLRSSEHPFYDLSISGVRNDETFLMMSQSGSKHVSHEQKGPILTAYMPANIGSPGGISTLELSMEKGESHKLEIPWGIELLEYAKGNK